MSTVVFVAQMVHMRSLCAIGMALLTTSLAQAGDDDADRGPRAVRRAFPYVADPVAIERAACSLQPRGESFSRTFAVRVGDKTCDGPASPDAIVLVVRIAPGAGGAQEIVVEAEPPDEASSGEVTTIVELTARALESLLTNPVVRAKGPWYGWQIILGTIAVDVAGTAGVMGVDAAANGQIAPIALAAVTAVSARVFLGPVVHLLHHEPGHAAWSLGLELGLPIATSLTWLAVGALATNGRVDNPLTVLALGAIPGAFIAPIIDSAALGTKHVEPGDRRTAARSFAIVPVVGPTKLGLDAVASF